MNSAHAQTATETAPPPAAALPATAPAGEPALPDITSGETRRLLEQKFRALNLLSGGIAHEFNNIIAGVLGSAELIAMDVPSDHPAHESLKQIVEASNRGRDFLHKVRTFAQRLPVDRRPVLLPPVIEESLQILRGIIPDKVELKTHIQTDCPPVNADAAQIQQVILELCLYCWQGLHERRGHITLTLENSPSQFPATLPPGCYVQLTIRDDSQGLDQSALNKIFDPFHARRSSKKVGLELFMARETIHAHLGEVTAESEPGKGLAFHIHLPVMEEAG